MATLKTTGTKTTRSIVVREDRFNPRVYVTLEIGDELVSVNRVEVLDAIGAVEPTPTPATPTATRRDADTVVVGEVAYVARSGQDIERYDKYLEFLEWRIVESRAVAKFLRAEQAQARKPVAAEIVALMDAYQVAFPQDKYLDRSAFLKLHEAGLRILP